MSPEFSPQLQAELLNDFYAEADEHLGNLRAQLATLEGVIGQSTPDAAVLESIFRSAHSFKGISAMVGLRAAEQLAHSAEDYLRQLSRHALRLTPHGFEVLVATTQRLEQIVTAHRLQRELPEVGELVAELGALQTSPAGSEAGAAAHGVSAIGPSANTSLSAAGTRWECVFTPSRLLDERGVNINAVRTRLGAIGTVESATPTVKPGGAIVFTFVVRLRETPTDLAAWEADGMVFRPLEAPRAKPAAFAGAEESSLFIAPSHIVRVDLSRLDELMRITGEMVIHRSRLEERIAQGGDARGLRDVNLALGRALRDLRTAITRVRLVPVAEIFTRMPFVVRDLARDSGKQVRLQLEGQQTEIDKFLVERLKEPLLHLVRNAFSHGIETPAERIAAGKPAEATILLRAEAAGDAVLIHIRDDGGGVDAEAVAKRATDLGIALPARLDAAGLLNVLCTPGFSTRDEADLASGRGVGMAVVRDAVRELGGTLSLETTPGRGTHFTLRLPLTLSIAEVLIAVVGTQTVAVPQGSVAEIVQIADGDVRTIKGTEVVPYRNGLLPLIRLRTMFGGAAPARAQVPVIVVHSERGRTGLVVDRMQGQREVVVRPLRDPLLQVPGIAGATELGDGRPVLILEAVSLTQGVVRPNDAETADAAEPPLAHAHS